MIRHPLQSRLAFVLGFGFTLLPAFGPIVAILLLLSRPWRLERGDLVWGGAAFLYALPGFLTGGWTSGLLGVGTIAGPWIVYRTFRELKAHDAVEVRGRHVGLSLLGGFAAVVAIGLFRVVAGLNVDTALSLSDAIVWQDSPAFFGHTVLVLGALISLLTRESPRVSWSAMALAALGVLFSGSREAAVAWIVLGFLQIVIRDADARRPRATELAVLGLMIAMAVGLAPVLGWGRIGFLVSPAPSQSTSPNLFAGTEVPEGDWWDDRWVDVRTQEVTLADTAMTAYDVRKSGPENWLRLQQLVRLTPGTTYTLSGWIEASDETVPGFQGWAQLPENAGAFVVIGTLRDGEWDASVLGPGALVAARILQREGSWHRVAATFTYAAEAAPATWFVGFTPDARAVEGTSGRVAGMQLEEGERATAYRPGPATRGLSFGLARAPMWHVAWHASLKRPLFGWGTGAFSELYQEAEPGHDRLQIVPAHPHNQLLHTLVERGLVGVVALAFLLVALFGAAVRQRDVGLLAVVFVVLLANVFESMLLFGGVLYPLAGAAGWRSARTSARRSEEAEHLRQFFVRLVLVAGSAAAALLALLAARGAFGLAGAPFAITLPLLYSALLWPVASWREGLFPGYGLTPSQELSRQTAAAATASLAAIVAALVLRDGPPIPPLALGVTLVGTFVTLPVVRALAKRLMNALGLWGRPVLVLGSGPEGRQVVRILSRTPLGGLHPIGVFDEDPVSPDSRIDGVRIRGSLADAAPFARRHHVNHVIVARRDLDTERMNRLTGVGARTFRYVQFLPGNGALPFENVRATDVAGMLMLEVKMGLASPLNRTIKRTFDLLAVVLGGILISPLLIALAAAIYLDSPGPVFYRQKRIGRGGRHFWIWKFRSMVPDADVVLARYLDVHPELRAEWEATQKLRYDPRVTRVGSFLRSTSLDELPQLWNVLIGEMSLVGPRPIIDEEVARYGHVFDLYKVVRPGMTGHWQVSGRSDTSYESRVAMDAYYVRNWTVWFDTVVLLKTGSVVLKKDGAY